MKRGRVYLAGGGAVAAVLGVAVYLMGTGDDRTLTFVREVPSQVEPAVLGKALTNLANWPRWHFMVDDAKAVNGAGWEYPPRDQLVMTGETIVLKVSPKVWRHFQLEVEVTQSVKDQMFEVVLRKDGSGKIDRLFDRLKWRVELMAPPPGFPKEFHTWIKGTLVAHTRSWRARFLARVAERILLSQAFYPNLEELAKIATPLSLRPNRQTEQ